jgi:anaerobic selenocysteine-containing dehydrogenase
LPPTFSLEHDNYDLAFHLLAVRNTAKFSPALFERAPDARHDWEILAALAARIGKGDEIQDQLIRQIKILVGEHLSPKYIIDLGLRMGEYGGKLNPFATAGLSLKKLLENPHGIDLGPLRPVFPQRLFTRAKKVLLAPEVFCQDLERLEKSQTELQKDELLLIGRRELRTNNSWIHNSHRMVKGKARCTLIMNPQDAAKRSLENGQAVKVSSRVGQVEVPVEISDEIMPGVVSLPHGWGHNRPGSRLRVASQTPGVSINDLTDHARVDSLSGVAAFSATPVKVTPTASAPAVVV